MMYRGFSLMEVLLAIALMAAIIVSVSSSSLPVLNRSSVNGASAVIIMAVNQAQDQATKGTYKTNSGIRILGNGVVVFSGESYSTRDTTKDSFIELPPSVRVSGNTEFVFSRPGGVTSPGTIMINSGSTGRVIKVNRYGVYE